MRIKRKAFFITFLLLFSIGTVAHAADVAKIGIVDFQKVLKVSSAGKMAQAEFRKMGKKIETELNKKGSEIDALKKELEREALVMSAEMREKKEREIRININDFKTLEKKFRKEFRDYNEQLVDRIKKEVMELVQEIGKNEGYLMIMERNDGGVLYMPNSIDITDKLIEKYNADYAKNNKKSG